MILIIVPFLLSGALAQFGRALAWHARGQRVRPRYAPEGGVKAVDLLYSAGKVKYRQKHCDYNTAYNHSEKTNE